MFKLLTQVLVFLSFMGSALAAEFTVRKYSNSENYYIELNGTIEEGDAQRLEDAYLDTRVKAGAELIMFSPGGNGYVMKKVAAMVQKYGLVTRVSSEGTCHSACAVIWSHGKRKIADNGAEIGFHVSSVRGPAVTEYISAYGYLAFQQFVQEGFSEDLQYYLSFDVPRPDLLALNILKYGYTADKFWLPTNSELEEILGAEINY